MGVQILIQDLSTSHIADVVNISIQLGKSVEPSETKIRIEQIMAHPDHSIFVATLNEGFVGYIHCAKSFPITSSLFVEIIGLVVDESKRRKGIGTLLVAAVEEKFSGIKVRVRCNVRRTAAHKFYNSLDYREIKEQKVFLKG